MAVLLEARNLPLTLLPGLVICACSPRSFSRIQAPMRAPRILTAAAALLIAVGILLGAAARTHYGASAVQIGDDASTLAAPDDVLLLSNDSCITEAAKVITQDLGDVVLACLFPEGYGALSRGPAFLDVVTNIVMIAAAASQRNGVNDLFDPPPSLEACNNDIIDDLAELVCALDARDGKIDLNFSLTPEDFTRLNIGASQLHDKDGSLSVIVFVEDDTDTVFDTSVGTWRIAQRTFATRVACASIPLFDEDCDGDGLRGDGVIVANLSAAPVPVTAPAPRGPGEFTIERGGTQTTIPITVVGEPERIEIEAFEQSVQTGTGVCEQEAGQPDYESSIGRAEETLIVMRAFDSDGTAVEGAWALISSSDPAKLVPADAFVSTIHTPHGARADVVLCGGVMTGAVTVTAELLTPERQVTLLVIIPDPFSGGDVETIAFGVVDVLPTSTSTSTATASPTDTGTATSTHTPTVTLTSTPTPSATASTTSTPSPTSTASPTRTPHAICADIDGDGVVTVRDLGSVARRLGRHKDHDERYDLNGDGRIDVRDLLIVVRQLRTPC